MARLRRPTPTASLDPAAWLPADEARRIYNEVVGCATPNDLVAWMDAWPRPWPFRIAHGWPLALTYWHTRAGCPPADYDPEQTAMQILAAIAAHRRGQALGEDDGWRPDDADVRALLTT